METRVVPRDYSIYDLIGRKLILFGAGEMLAECLNRFGRFWSDEVIAIVDNSSEKWGRKIGVGKTTVEISDANRMACLICAGALVLVTTSFIESVYEQLSNTENCGEFECCYYDAVCAKTNKIDERKRVYPESFRLTEEPMIPKIIHYCWFGDSGIPEKNLCWINKWQELCTDYKIMRWDESNYDISWSPYMREAYRQKKWGFVPDVARLDIIYRYGGIYLDTDVELVRNIDDLLYAPCFFGIESSYYVNLGLGFGAMPQSSVVKTLLQEYKGRCFDTTPSPMIQSHYFQKEGYLGNGDYYRNNKFVLYPPSVLAAKDGYSREINVMPHSYSIHHYDASWVDKRNKSAREKGIVEWKKIMRV